MKNYFRVILMITSLIMLFGFLLPYLFSEDSNESELAGIVILLLYVPFAYKFIKKIWSDIIN